MTIWVTFVYLLIFKEIDKFFLIRILINLRNDIVNNFSIDAFCQKRQLNFIDAPFLEIQLAFNIRTTITFIVDISIITKEINNKAKRQPTKWEKIFAYEMTD